MVGKSTACLLPVHRFSSNKYFFLVPGSCICVPQCHSVDSLRLRYFVCPRLATQSCRCCRSWAIRGNRCPGAPYVRSAFNPTLEGQSVDVCCVCSPAYFQLKLFLFCILPATWHFVRFHLEEIQPLLASWIQIWQMQNSSRSCKQTPASMLAGKSCC